MYNAERMGWGLHDSRSLETNRVVVTGRLRLSGHSYTFKGQAFVISYLELDTS